jgi:hypothetical protein
MHNISCNNFIIKTVNKFNLLKNILTKGIFGILLKKSGDFAPPAPLSGRACFYLFVPQRNNLFGLGSI